jgi:hypothetical protein
MYTDHSASFEHGTITRVNTSQAKLQTLKRRRIQVKRIELAYSSDKGRPAVKSA